MSAWDDAMAASKAGKAKCDRARLRAISLLELMVKRCEVPEWFAKSAAEVVAEEEAGMAEREAANDAMIAALAAAEREAAP